MKIKVTKIDISYFKGIRNLTIDCNRDVVDIYGCNGSGKTTIADAIQWCLFGKNSNGDTKFSIKTLNDNGEVISNVEHSVMLSLDVDGKSVDIKRVWVEDKVISRGRETDEVKHHAEFYINGEKFTKKDFDIYMSNIIDEEHFRAVTSPTFFTSLKWQDQRDMLSNMIGAVDYSELNSRPEYKDVVEKITEHGNLTDYLKHLSYNVKQVKEKLQQIPSRIDENRQKLECQDSDFEGAKKANEVLQKELEEKTALLAGLKAGNESYQSQAIRNQIEFQHKRIDNMRISAQNLSKQANDDHQKELHEAYAKANIASSDLHNIESKVKSHSVLIGRVKEQLEEIELKIVKFRKEWADNEKSQPDIQIEEFCPVCGHPFSEERKSEMKTKIIEQHNLSKATIKADLRKTAENLKAEKAEAEALKQSYNEELASIDIQQYLNAKNDADAVVAELKEKVIPTADDLLSKNPSYRDALTELHELELKLDGEITTDNSEAIAKLNAEISAINQTMKENNIIIGSEEIYRWQEGRIKELEKEQETLIIQLDKLMLSEDIAKGYEQDCNELMETEVNTMFSLVQFRLFDTLNDGTKKPNCIAWVKTSKGLVPFADANAGQRVNAGRDIVNALQKYYDVYAPTVTDNAEGVNELLPINAQDIRLYVSTDKNLVVK